VSLPRRSTPARPNTHPSNHPASWPGKRLRRRLGTRLLGLTGVLTAFTMLPTTAGAATWPGHPDRSVVRYVVRPGDTATGLAVRYHAWTDELIRLNRLGSTGALHRGQVLRIPIVVSAARRAGVKVRHHAKPRVKKHAGVEPSLHRTRPPGRGWLHADMSRTQVRALITTTARRYGVPPELALAIAWQESGWQQRRVSSAGALGVMQVMPDTGRWMRWYVGRPLRLRDTHDNVLAGVMAIRVLRAWTHKDNSAIAAYYQGLGAVRRHGFFDDTKVYVASVRAHERRISRTGSPV
jgi:LysM repeat protein